MNVNTLLQEKRAQRAREHFITFEEGELHSLRADQAEYLIEQMHGNTLVRLPDSEIVFFEWLKDMDRRVWDDLWDADEADYLVSVDFLRQFIDDSPSFPICDLVDQPNYWFCNRHIKPKGLEELQLILIKLENDEQLSTAELFMYEISLSATDLWHFCHKHNLNVQAMKAVIEDMVYKGWLVHLPDREDLVKYFDL